MIVGHLPKAVSSILLLLRRGGRSKREMAELHERWQNYARDGRTTHAK